MPTDIKKLYRTALLGGAATLLVGSITGVGFTNAAMAQQADDDEAVEEVIVTGTRLQNTAVSSPVPILQISAEEIQGRGVIRLEEMLNRMPQLAPGQNAQISNGASGTSQLNLRGLGAVRTLVLVNGKRLPFGSPTSSASNIDIVPAGMVERIDIVTGGASAVYGSDAVGGVVNFILKDDFEGLEVSGQVGVHHAPNQNGLLSDILAAAGAGGDPQSPIGDPSAVIDGREVSINMTLGANFDSGRGNVTLHAAYQNANAITQDNRDFSACALSSGGGINGNHRCAGSSNFRKFNIPVGASARVRALADGNLVGPSDPGFATASTFNTLFQQPDGTLVNISSLSSTATSFNFGPFNFMQRPNERYNINAIGHYDVTDTIEFYADLAFMNNFTNAQIAPSASFNRPFQTNCDNPLLLTGLNDTGSVSLFDIWDCAAVIADFNAGNRDNKDIKFINSHRNVEGGPRNLAIDVTTWRVVTGFRGTLADKFDWDVFGQISKVNLARQSSNDLSFARVQQALFVVDDGNGNAICDPAKSPDAACVPWNIFNRSPDGSTLIGQDTVDFIAGNGIVIGKTEQRVMGATVQTDLTDQGIKSPMAEAGASVLGGFEYRKDILQSNPDDVSRISAGRGLTGTGGGTLPVSGQVSVWELFMEAQIPLVQDRPGMKEVSLSGAFRHSEYSTDGNGVSNKFGTNTFFYGGSWTPVDQIRFRAQFQRAIRAPNVINLFTGQNTGLFGATQLSNGTFEPCAGTTPIATVAQCQNTGLSASQYGNVALQPAGQLNTVTGGNPNLIAETSDTITVGAVLTPEAIPGLTIAVDYFDIKIDDAIGTIPAQTILDQCIATGEPVFCSLIQRDSFGTLWLDNSNFEGIQITNTNVANFTRTGIDVQASYDMDLEDIGLDNLGSLRFDFAGTYVLDDSNTPVPGVSVTNKCDGLFAGSCGAPNPKWRHNMRTTWNTPWDVRATLTWRWFSATNNAGNISDPTDLNRKVARKQYFDLVLRYQATEAVEARFGVNNLLATTPHFSSQGGNGNIFAGQQDLDRFIFFGVNLSY